MPLYVTSNILVESYRLGPTLIRSTIKFSRKSCLIAATLIPGHLALTRSAMLDSIIELFKTSI